MSGLTEQEILSCLRENLRLAAENADRLANGERGFHYLHLRRELKLVEGCCRQMAGWREDTRWLPFGMKIAEAQLRCGRWLREKQPAWRFKGLAEILRYALAQALDLECKRAPHLGIVLPKPLPAPTRTEGRSVLVPEGYRDIRNRGIEREIVRHKDGSESIWTSETRNQEREDRTVH